LICNWLSLILKAKEEYNPKTLHLGGKKWARKMDLWPFVLHKEPLSGKPQTL
jgi:hypothetical protein